MKSGQVGKMAYIVLERYFCRIATAKLAFLLMALTGAAMAAIIQPGAVIASNISIAQYANPQYEVLVSTSPQNLNPQPAGGGIYSYGQTVILTANPVQGYIFQRWIYYSRNANVAGAYISSSSTLSTSPSYSFTITGNQTFVAEYSPAYTISVSTLPSGLNPQPAGGGNYPEGQTITITAQEVTGYTFRNWTENGNEVSKSTLHTLNVTGNQNLVAEYSQNQYTVSVSTSPQALNPQPDGGALYYYGQTATVVAQQVPGYTFKRWTEDGNQVSTSTSYSFTVSGNRNLMAEYSSVFTVSVSTSPPSLDPQPRGGGNYPEGKTIMVDAQPVSGYTFRRWIENGNLVYEMASYSFTVAGNRNLVAEYSPDQYIISVSTSPQALDPQPDGAGIYNYEQMVTVAAHPVSGYTFRNWTQKGNLVSTNSSYSFTVTGNQSLVAGYLPLEASITLEPGSGAVGNEITVKGSDFHVFPGETPEVSGYFAGNIVKEQGLIEKDKMGSSGSFITTFKIPQDSKPGIYNVVAKGVRDTASIGFEVKETVRWDIIVFVLVLVIVSAGVILKYSYLAKQNPPHPQINIEARGGIVSEYKPDLQRSEINIEVRGGMRRL
ncbi:Listeria-Bacteroides repeat domain (List_Bact_rpt) [uncultured archaeon]|nr:Listeria-Bacteroides repeat domain (List_Bact_rpt) [uncultured archaeon]